MNRFRFAIPRWLAGASFPKTVEEIQWLHDQGFRTIISLETLRECDELMAKISSLGIRHIDMHIPDGEEPLLGQTELFMQAVDQSIIEDRPVFCHCLAGCGRTGMMLMYYLLTRLDLTFDEAWDMVGGTVTLRDQTSFLYDYYQTLPRSKGPVKRSIDQSLLEEFKRLNLRGDEATIAWGAAMALHGLRDCHNDLDAIVTEECFTRLSCEFPDNLGGKIRTGRLELCLGSASYCVFPEDAIRRSIQIDGVSVVCLKDLLAIKKARNKPKDRRDIVLLKIRLAGGGS